MSVKVKRRAKIVLDMTPMVDIAFLLVIFFMSTYHARPPATVTVNLPESRSPFKVPEANVMLVNVLNPEQARQLADSIGPTNLLDLIQTIKEVSAQSDLTVDGLRSRLPNASKELLEEVVSAPSKPLSRGRAAELAIREAQRPNNYLWRLSKQEVPTMNAQQLTARVDSLTIWYTTGRESAQPLPMDQLAQTIRDERIRNPRLMLVLMVDKKCLSGKMLDLSAMLGREDVKMLRFSLVTNLKATAKPMFGEEEGR